MNIRRTLFNMLFLPLCISTSIMHGMEHKKDGAYAADPRTSSASHASQVTDQTAADRHALAEILLARLRHIRGTRRAAPPSTPVTAGVPTAYAMLPTFTAADVPGDIIFAAPLQTIDQSITLDRIHNSNARTTRTPAPSPARNRIRIGIQLRNRLNRILAETDQNRIPAAPPASPVTPSTVTGHISLPSDQATDASEIEFSADLLEAHTHITRIARAALSRVQQTPLPTYAPVPSLALSTLHPSIEPTAFELSAPAEHMIEVETLSPTGEVVATEPFRSLALTNRARTTSPTSATDISSGSPTPASSPAVLSASSTSPETVRRSPTILETLQEMNAAPSETVVGNEHIILQSYIQPSSERNSIMPFLSALVGQITL